MMSAMRRNKNTLANERGIALLLVLWVIVFLTFICAEFSWTMRTETSAAANFKEGTQAYYAAEAGINRSIIELLRVAAESSVYAGDEDAEDEEEDEEGEENQQVDAADELADFDDEEAYDEMQLWLAGGGPYRLELGDFYCEVSIIDASNKININAFLKESSSDPTKLKSLLNRQMGLEGEELDIVADSLIDWWDKDSNITGVSGAEDEYYESLDPPYGSRNGDMQAIEECLLVQGVTEEIFYGRGRRMEERVHLVPEELDQLLSGEGLSGPLDYEEEDFGREDSDSLQLGLVDIFSVTSNEESYRVNVNTASVEQLMMLEGMQEESAQEIIIEREDRLFQNPADRLPQYANYEVWKEKIKVTQPHDLNSYIVHARGFSPDGRISRGIRCSLFVADDECIISDWRVDG